MGVIGHLDLTSARREHQAPGLTTMAAVSAGAHPPEPLQARHAGQFKDVCVRAASPATLRNTAVSPLKLSTTVQSYWPR